MFFFNFQTWIIIMINKIIYIYNKLKKIKKKCKCKGRLWSADVKAAVQELWNSMRIDMM